MSNISRPQVQLHSSKNEDLIFSRNNDYFLQPVDFDNCNISGELYNISNTFSGNFRSCNINSLTCEKMTFFSADILDCQITDTQFIHTKFDTSHLAGCIVRNTKFRNCNISNINFGRNIFHRVIFENCEFDTFVFKNSKFFDCKFFDCNTFNHTFDSCFFDDTYFTNFCILPTTILLNIGLFIHSFKNPIFYNKRPRDGAEKIASTDFFDLIKRSASGMQEQISAYVFSAENELALINNVTKILKEGQHVSIGISRGFTEKLELLVNFLNLMYENNQLIALNIIQIQDYLNQLSNKLNNAKQNWAIQFRNEVDSLRLSNSNNCSEVLEEISYAHEKLEGVSLIAISADETMQLYQFQKLFEENPNIIPFQIKSRNSPIALFIELIDWSAIVAIVSIIISTRFKYQLDRGKIFQDEQDENLNNLSFQKNTCIPKISANRALKPKKTDDLILKKHFELGLISSESVEFGLRITSSFQSGLVKKLELTFSPKRAVNFHKHLFGFLGTHRRKES